MLEIVQMHDWGATCPVNEKGNAMTCRWFNIDNKHRPHNGYHASLKDFTVSVAESVGPEILTQRHDLSLYCLDHKNQNAIFVELPAAVDLTEATFIYLTQYEEALRLLEVPFEDFLRAAEDLPKIIKLVMMYMTGRCGSTLMSKAFNGLDGVMSLAEPDAPISFVHEPTNDAERRPEHKALLDASLRFLYRTPSNTIPDVCVLKLRSEALQIADLIQSTYPDIKNLFLYRDPLGFVGSFYRLFKRGEFPESFDLDGWRGMNQELFNINLDRLLPLLGRQVEQLSDVEFLALWWISVMERYAARVDEGLPVTAVHYDDLKAHEKETLSRILEVCDLNNLKLTVAMKAFETDSQEGTFFARARSDESHLKLSIEQIGTVETILSRHPAINTPGYIAPGTLKVD